MSDLALEEAEQEYMDGNISYEELQQVAEDLGW